MVVVVRVQVRVVAQRLVPRQVVVLVMQGRREEHGRRGVAGDRRPRGAAAELVVLPSKEEVPGGVARVRDLVRVGALEVLWRHGSRAQGAPLRRGVQRRAHLEPHGRQVVGGMVVVVAVGRPRVHQSVEHGGARGPGARGREQVVASFGNVDGRGGRGPAPRRHSLTHSLTHYHFMALHCTGTLTHFTFNINTGRYECGYTHNAQVRLGRRSSPRSRLAQQTTHTKRPSSDRKSVV